MQDPKAIAPPDVLCIVTVIMTVYSVRYHMLVQNTLLAYVVVLCYAVLKRCRNVNAFIDDITENVVYAIL